MREIKVRAFDPRRKIMSLPIPMEGLINYMNQGEKYWPGHPAGLPVWKDLIWMLFTTLQDKKGVDLYEGDILKQLGNRGRMWNAAVEFNFASFWARGRLKSDVVRLDIYLYGDGAKVIGNIHENPELLEK